MNPAFTLALDVLQVMGVVAFAISGALAAGTRRMDWFGVIVLGVIVAVGGGSLRDTLMGAAPVFWIHAPWYLAVAAASAAATIPLASRVVNHYRYVLVADGAGLAVFVIAGTSKALEVGIGPAVSVVLGVITGVAGGLFRDVLCNKVPVVLQRDIYALAALTGAGAYVLLREAPLHPVHALWLSALMIFALRMTAVVRNWSLPVLDLSAGNSERS